MVWLRRFIYIVSVVCFCFFPLGVVAWANSPSLEPSLVFRELEITGNEFIVLENNGTGDITNLSSYWLGYVSSDTSVAPPVQQLPNKPLKAGQAMLLSGGSSLDICDAVIVANLVPSLSNTAGTVMLWQQTGTDFVQLAAPQSTARWSKPTLTTVLDPSEINLKQETSQYTNPVWYFDSTGWKVGNLDICSLTTYAASADNIGVEAANWPPSASQPPAIIESLSDDGTDDGGPSLPLSDVGLMPLQINELLPNPSGTGTDGTDEFIEMYNPNNVSFDLSGFRLQTGLNTKHDYIFPSSVTVPAKSFKAFYSADTGLSMSNTGGQADLLDPFGTMIAQTDVYGSAKDGLAWALANGNWYWTAKATPNGANVVNQTSATTTKSTGTSVTGAKTSANGQTKAASTANGNTAASGSSQDTAEVTPIHPTVLAAVAAAAVAYGLYEYRHDVANRIHQFRTDRADRRTGRK